MNKKLAERVREARGEVKPAEFSRLIGISRSALSQIESGRTNVLKVGTAFKMQDASGYSARWIALNEGPKKVAKRPEDSIPTEIIEFAIKVFENTTPTDRPLLAKIFARAVPDSRLGDGWGAKSKRSQ